MENRVGFLRSKYNTHTIFKPVFFVFTSLQKNMLYTLQKTQRGQRKHHPSKYVPKCILQHLSKTNSSYFYLLFRLILFVLAYIYLWVVQGVQCVRRGFCSYCHRLDTYSSVHDDQSDFGIMCVASRNHCTTSIYVFVHIYLFVCILLRGLFCLGRPEKNLLADMTLSLCLFAASMGLEHISMEMSSSLFISAGSQMIH